MPKPFGIQTCPAMSFAAEQAMARAGVRTEDISMFDLYSCFPVAVELACEKEQLKVLIPVKHPAQKAVAK